MEPAHETTYIGAGLAVNEQAEPVYVVVEYVSSDESSRFGLYRVDCHLCGGSALIWIDLFSGGWRWQSRCPGLHRKLYERYEQRYALLLACAA